MKLFPLVLCPWIAALLAVFSLVAAVLIDFVAHGKTKEVDVVSKLRGVDSARFIIREAETSARNVAWNVQDWQMEGRHIGIPPLDNASDVKRLMGLATGMVVRRDLAYVYVNGRTPGKLPDEPADSVWRTAGCGLLDFGNPSSGLCFFSRDGRTHFYNMNFGEQGWMVESHKDLKTLTERLEMYSFTRTTRSMNNSDASQVDSSADAQEVVRSLPLRQQTAWSGPYVFLEQASRAIPIQSLVLPTAFEKKTGKAISGANVDVRLEALSSSLCQVAQQGLDVIIIDDVTGAVLAIARGPDELSRSAGSGCTDCGVVSEWRIGTESVHGADSCARVFLAQVKSGHDFVHVPDSPVPLLNAVAVEAQRRGLLHLKRNPKRCAGNPPIYPAMPEHVSDECDPSPAWYDVDGSANGLVSGRDPIAAVPNGTAFSMPAGPDWPDVVVSMRSVGYPSVRWVAIGLARVNTPRQLVPVHIALLCGIALLVVIAGAVVAVCVHRIVANGLASVANRLAAASVLRCGVSPTGTVSKRSGAVELARLQEMAAAAELTLASVARYLPTTALQDLAVSGALGSARLERSTSAIVFCDVVNFTRVCDSRAAPGTVSNLLTTFISGSVAMLDLHGGVLDKLMGDALMAVWGASRPVADPEVRAALCALRIGSLVSQPAAAESFFACAESAALNQPEDGEADEFPAQLSCKVGVHFGPVVVGNVGCHSRLSHTCMGQSVATAAHLCALNRRFASVIIATGAVVQRLPRVVVFRALARVMLGAPPPAGRGDLADIYELVGVMGPVVAPTGPVDRLAESDRRSVVSGDVTSPRGPGCSQISGPSLQRRLPHREAAPAPDGLPNLAVLPPDLGDAKIPATVSIASPDEPCAPLRQGTRPAAVTGLASDSQPTTRKGVNPALEVPSDADSEPAPPPPFVTPLSQLLAQAAAHCPVTAAESSYCAAFGGAAAAMAAGNTRDAAHLLLAVRAHFPQRTAADPAWELLFKAVKPPDATSGAAMVDGVLRL